MWPYAEFLVGFATFGLGLSAIALALRQGRGAARLLLVLALIVEVLVFMGLFLDWGYDWFDRTALDIALNSNVWVALPHALALMVLIVTVFWGEAAAPWAVLLAGLQSTSFLPVIFLVELDTDSSFLSPVPLASMYLSLLAAFFLLPAAWSHLPPEGSRWHRIAFAPRAQLIEAIRSLGALGFSVLPPETILESPGAPAERSATPTSSSPPARRSFHQPTPFASGVHGQTRRKRSQFPVPSSRRSNDSRLRNAPVNTTVSRLPPSASPRTLFKRSSLLSHDVVRGQTDSSGTAGNCSEWGWWWRNCQMVHSRWKVRKERDEFGRRVVGSLSEPAWSQGRLVVANRRFDRNRTQPDGVLDRVLNKPRRRGNRIQESLELSRSASGDTIRAGREPKTVPTGPEGRVIRGLEKESS